MRDNIARKRAKKPDPPPEQVPQRTGKTDAPSKTTARRTKKPKADQKKQPPMQPSSTGRHLVNIRFNAVLQESLKNMIEGSTRAGDYTGVQSVPQFIRRALRAYKAGMSLTEAAISGPKKRFTITFDDELKKLYDSLPPRRRTEIIERAVRTFLRREEFDL